MAKKSKSPKPDDGEDTPIDFTDANQVLTCQSLVGWDVGKLSAADGAIEKWLSMLTSDWLPTSCDGWRSHEIEILVLLVESGLVDLRESQNGKLVTLSGAVWSDGEIEISEAFSARLSHDGVQAKADLADPLLRGHTFAHVRGWTPFTAGAKAEPVRSVTALQQDGPCGSNQWRHDGEVLAGTMQVGAWKMVKHLWGQPEHVARFDDLLVPVYGDPEHIADDNAFGTLRREANKFFKNNGIPWKASLKKGTVSLGPAE